MATGDSSPVKGGRPQKEVRWIGPGIPSLPSISPSLKGSNMSSESSSNVRRSSHSSNSSLDFGDIGASPMVNISSLPPNMQYFLNRMEPDLALQTLNAISQSRKSTAPIPGAWRDVAPHSRSSSSSRGSLGSFSAKSDGGLLSPHSLPSPQQRSASFSTSQSYSPLASFSSPYSSSSSSTSSDQLLNMAFSGPGRMSPATHSGQWNGSADLSSLKLTPRGSRSEIPPMKDMYPQPHLRPLQLRSSSPSHATSRSFDIGEADSENRRSGFLMPIRPGGSFNGAGMCGMQSNTSLPFVADEGLPAVIRLAVDALKIPVRLPPAPNACESRDSASLPMGEGNGTTDTMWYVEICDVFRLVQSLLLTTGLSSYQELLYYYMDMHFTHVYNGRTSVSLKEFRVLILRLTFSVLYFFYNSQMWLSLDGDEPRAHSTLWTCQNFTDKELMATLVSNCRPCGSLKELSNICATRCVMHHFVTPPGYLVEKGELPVPQAPLWVVLKLIGESVRECSGLGTCASGCRGSCKRFPCYEFFQDVFQLDRLKKIVYPSCLYSILLFFFPNTPSGSSLSHDSSDSLTDGKRKRAGSLSTQRSLATSSGGLWPASSEAAAKRAGFYPVEAVGSALHRADDAIAGLVPHLREDLFLPLNHSNASSGGVLKRRRIETISRKERLSSDVKHLPLSGTAAGTKRQKCKLCWARGHERKTKFWCSECKVFLCITDDRECFAEWHTAPDIHFL